MTDTFSSRLNLLANPALLPELTRINRGIEKEGLRATSDGLLSQKPHPQALGSALTHPHITTDYSEALLEFITPVHTSAEEVIEFLRDIHRFVYSQLDDEVIWTASMPCFIGGELTIPIADYGSSNIGQLKHIYRIGLAHRYGKMMQTIAGIHYNFSLPNSFWPIYQSLSGDPSDAESYRTEAYFGLIRNFNRCSWLLLYLFGASPALCSCFLEGRPHQLKSISQHTLYKPHATSLRMGDLGYQNSTQKQLNVSYDGLSQYVTSLGNAIHTPHQPYEELGIVRDGKYRQLNSNILQIENEYYSDIRPKRVTPSGEKPINVLAREGVEYIEVRNLDINPFTLAGIDEPQIRFLDCFLLCCLLKDSPLISADENAMIAANKELIVNRGREPGLMLHTEDGTKSLVELTSALFDKIEGVAHIMDNALGGKDHLNAVKLQQEKLNDSSATPSARILDSLSSGNSSFSDFGMERAHSTRDLFAATKLAEEKEAYFNKLAAQSLQQQQEIEQSDDIPFAEFLDQYNAQ